MDTVLGMMPEVDLRVYFVIKREYILRIEE